MSSAGLAALVSGTLDEFHYEFTECDASGGRWGMKVHNEDCVGGPPPSPTRITDCSVSCDQGKYFNMTKLSCSLCPAGTYSLGGGVHYSSFQSLPTNFYSYTEAFRSAFTVSRRRGDDVDCNQYGWQPRNGVLASAGGPCAAILVYTVKLVKPGSLLYSYQYTDNAIIFEFQAQDEQCQSIDDADRAKWPALTKENKWKTVRIQLNAGLNVLHWKTIGIDIRGSSRPVMIKTIEVTGVAYTSECSPCPVGTYSPVGSRECSKCPQNTHSSIPGSSRCISCNPKMFFAPKGSSTCRRRPPCTSQDYYEIDSPCDESNKTRAIYHWVEPQICREDIPSSAGLPISGKMKPCPPCNPGMQYKSGSGCAFCPKGEQSDGLSACKPCPPNTAPNYAHEYQWWPGELPPGMTATCMSTEDVTCSHQKGWKSAGSHIHSGRGHGDDAYLVLSLKIPGFRGREGFVNGQPMEVGRISFTFELMCSTECEFLFMEGSGRREFNILKSWKGLQVKQYYSYIIRRNDSYTFSWAFQKISWEKSYSTSNSRVYESDVAKIFNINVTNTINGGASSCQTCAQGVHNLGCIPCPLGYFIDETMTCTACPDDKVVTENLPFGPQSCVSCGPSLLSLDRLTCTAKCNLTVEGSYVDLTNISQARVTIGSTLFTSSGTKYYHMFNMSLCGDVVVSCTNNVSYNLEMEATSVQARVCRSTIVPGIDDSSKNQITSLATQSVSLGDHLIGVSKNHSLHGIIVIKEFIDSKGKDINFFFTSPLSTRACPHGRSTTVTLRCVPEQSGQGQITLPHQCPDGTCDGCSFHFLWSTPLGCPICTKEDLITVEGECKSGKRQIHYISPEYCRQPENSPQSEVFSCSTRLPFMVEVFILGAAGIALFLSLLLYCLWKKNKSLEYKYMKLMANSNSKDGMMELPPAESCALQDDEEDEVMFAQKKGILNKFTYSRAVEENRLMETMKMNSTNHSHS